MAAAVFAFADRPAVFTDEPAVACAVSGWWRLANRDKRLWAAEATVTAETWATDNWRPVAVVEVEPLAGQVRVEGRHQQVRLSGSFLPLTEVATAGEWRVETTLATPGRTLAGGTGVGSRQTGGRVLFEQATVAGDLRGPLLVVADGYRVVASRAIRRGGRVELSFDAGCCRLVGG